MKNILETSSITKSFGGIKALKGINTFLKRGEVHALLGENGAGKSTFIKILSGAYTPDSGIVNINGQKFVSLTPQQSKNKGIATIYQETSLFPDLTVSENIFAGRLKKNEIKINWESMKVEALKLFADLGVNIDPKARLSSLGKATAQLVEIAKALSEESNILIMDEPTASLSGADTKKLFQIIRKLKQNGTAIFYISHHLEEVFEIADKATIFRDGEVVGSDYVKNIDERWIVSKMIGRDFISTKVRKKHNKTGEILLSVNNLSNEKYFKNISLNIHEKEVVGIAGLVGAGKTELLKAIFGIDNFNNGSVVLGKVKISSNVFKNIKHGLALIPEDRGKEGVVADISAALNLTMTIFRVISKLGFIQIKKEKNKAINAAEDLNIYPKNALNMPLSNFSGGNQQKIVLGRWLSGNPKVLLLDDPTQGVDVHAKFEIHKLIDEIISNGKGVLLVSSDFQELVDLSDRILIMNKGSITDELSNNCTVSDIIEKVSEAGKV